MTEYFGLFEPVAAAGSNIRPLHIRGCKAWVLFSSLFDPCLEVAFVRIGNGLEHIHIKHRSQVDHTAHSQQDQYPSVRLAWKSWRHL